MTLYEFLNAQSAFRQNTRETTLAVVEDGYEEKVDKLQPLTALLPPGLDLGIASAELDSKMPGKHISLEA